MPDPLDEQGKQYSDFIASELAAEVDRRSSVNTRAGSALTGAAGLVTLLLAVLVVVYGDDFTLTGWSKSFIVFSLLALLAGAFCAVMAGVSWRFKVTSVETLRSMTNQRWGDTEITARGVTAYCNTIVLASLRSGTSAKARWLLAASCCQLLAVGALAACSLSVLTTPADVHLPPPKGDGQTSQSSNRHG